MRRRPACLFFAVFAAILILLDAAGCPLIPEPRIRGPRNGHAALKGWVFSCEKSGSGSRIILRGTAAGRISLFVSGEQDFPAGTPLLAEGVLERAKKPENPGGYDEALYLKVRGIFYTMYHPELSPWKDAPKRSFLQLASDTVKEIQGKARSAARRRVSGIFPPEEAGIVCALLTGDRTMIGDDTKDLWRTGGVMHMLAISGLHLSVIGLGLCALLKRAGLGFAVQLALPSALMLLFAGFTGGSPSTLRALFMFLIRMAAARRGRPYDPPSALAAAGCAMLAENPYYLFFSGFQLSFAAVLICILFGKRGTFMTSLMLWLGMLPLVLGTYYEMPLYGVLVNLIAVPALPAILLSGMAGCVLGGAAVIPSVFMLRGLRLLLELCRGFPFSSVVFGSPQRGTVLLYYAALFVFSRVTMKYRLQKKRFLFFAMIPLLLLILRIRIRTGITVTCLSVGQGDGILIEVPGGGNVMIDGGSSSRQEIERNVILPCLKHEGITRLDLVFVSHADEDHISGIRGLFRDPAVKVRTLVLPDIKDEACDDLAADARAFGAEVIRTAAGDRFTLGKAVFDVLGPDLRMPKTADRNESCTVLALRYGDFDALFPGDVCGDGEENLIRYFRKRPGKFEMLKVAHHGSEYSTPDELLQIITPLISVISCGRNNLYGHPHEALLERLKKNGTKVLRTDLDGAVSVWSDGKNCRVSSARS